MTFSKTYRWGIIGTGKIAEKFAGALALVESTELYAIGSRNLATAKNFAEKLGATRFYGSYEELATDPNVDVVYVATPHARHAECAVFCMKNNKGVLCEKPLAISATQVFEMVSTARAFNTFLMEAMWSRFLPVIENVHVMVNAGMIGEIKSIKADFGFAAPYDPEHRLFNPKLGGGALLDVGVYPLFLCQLLLGNPETIQAKSTLADTGVDLITEAHLQYKNGATAIAYGGFAEDTGCTAEIIGSKGRIHIPTAWYKSDRLTLETLGGNTQEYIYEPVCNGFEYEIREVHHCMSAGVIESPFYSHAFSYDLALTMDAIRRQTGVLYPADQH